VIKREGRRMLFCAEKRRRRRNEVGGEEIYHVITLILPTSVSNNYILSVIPSIILKYHIFLWK
jgi:hypothetical protein